MNNFYDSIIGVEPFIILPQPFQSSDSGFILASKWMCNQESQIVNEVYKQVNKAKLKSPFFVQVRPIFRHLFVMTTFRSSVVDRKSGRHGLKITFGVAVERSNVDEIESRFLFCFDSIAKCLCEIAAKDEIVPAIESILTVFQMDAEASRQIEANIVFQTLLGVFEREFWKNQQTSSFDWAHQFTPTKILFSGLNQRYGSRPLKSVEDVREYWSSFIKIKVAPKLGLPNEKSLHPLVDEILKAELISKISTVLDKLSVALVKYDVPKKADDPNIENKKGVEIINDPKE